VSTALPEQLCLQCGLCCDGTLFRDVELQPGDDANHLGALGLALRGSRAGRSPSTSPATIKFPQPCAALCADLRCQVYAARPTRCREFGCALFKSVAAGGTEPAAALKVIRQTRQQAEQVRRLLQELGETSERVSLSKRFQKVKRQFDAGVVPAGLDRETAYDRFAELSLAVHGLDQRLRTKFHPDPTDG